MSIEVIEGDALAWLSSRSPSAWAVMLTDPPFGLGYTCGRGARQRFAGSIFGDSDTRARDAVLEWWGYGPAAVFGSRKVEHRGQPRGVLTWDKMGAGGMGDLSFPWKPDNSEEIAVYGDGWSGSRSSSVLRFPPTNVIRGKTHPHEKPVELLMAILAKAPAGPVLDPFGGTGAVAEAAHRLGRDCTVIELDPQWHPALRERVERLLRQLDMFREVSP